MTPQQEYDKAIQLITQGHKIDLEALRKKLNIPFEQTKPEIKISETLAPDLKEISDYKEKLRYGYKNQPEPAKIS